MVLSKYKFVSMPSARRGTDRLASWHANHHEGLIIEEEAMKKKRRVMKHRA